MNKIKTIQTSSYRFNKSQEFSPRKIKHNNSQYVSMDLDNKVIIKGKNKKGINDELVKIEFIQKEDEENEENDGNRRMKYVIINEYTSIVLPFIENLHIKTKEKKGIVFKKRLFLSHVSRNSIDLNIKI